MDLFLGTLLATACVIVVVAPMVYMTLKPYNPKPKNKSPHGRYPYSRADRKSR